MQAGAVFAAPVFVCNDIPHSPYPRIFHLAQGGAIGL